MRRETVLSLGLLVGLAALSGCGPEKELPKNIPDATDPGVPEAAPVPTASQPDAVKLVERCVAAATDGHPERLQKLKANRTALKGVLKTPAGFAPRVRRVEAVWPDRYYQADEYNENGPVTVTIGIRHPALWVRVVQDGKTYNRDPADPKVMELAAMEDAVGRHWLGSLLPVVEPGTVVFDAQKETVAGEPVDVVKVAVQGRPPVYTLWFEQKTGHLRQVRFAHAEDRVPVQKEFVLGGHKAFGGVMLPTKISYRQNGQVLEEWTVDSYEFPDRIDDATFERPPEGK